MEPRSLPPPRGTIAACRIYFHWISWFSTCDFPVIFILSTDLIFCDFRGSTSPSYINRNRKSQCKIVDGPDWRAGGSIWEAPARGFNGPATTAQKRETVPSTTQSTKSQRDGTGGTLDQQTEGGCSHGGESESCLQLCMWEFLLPLLVSHFIRSIEARSPAEGEATNATPMTQPIALGAARKQRRRRV